MQTAQTVAEVHPRLRRVEPPAAGVAVRLRRRARNAARALWSSAGRSIATARARLLRWRGRRSIDRQSGALRLCLGSGSAPVTGFVNIDLDGDPDVRLDLRAGLPVPDASVEFVYSEHLIEHLTCEEGLSLLRECRRVLRDSGVLRVATPDLGALVDAYRGDWRAQDWVTWPGHEWIDSPARMLNRAFHGWTHRHLYDGDELELRLRQAGFAATRRCGIGESEHEPLAGLETRLDSKLCVEAWGRRKEKGT